jgi:hypothetical protein
MSILAAVGELERAFGGLAPLFPNDLPAPVITIQSRGRRRVRAWFCGDKWDALPGGLLRPEINICAEDLACRPVDICECLLHEMVHESNWVDKIKDCTVNQYHNKNFAERCRAVGLVPLKGPRGWSETALSPDLLARVEALALSDDAFAVFRTSREQKKAPTKMLKWSCGCTIVRAATALDATCNGCGKPFVRR